jgi:DHA1 family inner membrane transport protein
VPTVQQALTADRPRQAMPIIAFQMAAMYLGSAAGSALGGGLLTAGADAADLAGWALVPAVLALLLTGGIALKGLGTRPQRQSAEEAVACEAAS